jgi:hypothetical protein
MDVTNGSELLLMAVRRDVRDLSVAHRIWDGLARTGRLPKTLTSFKYLRALLQREAEAYPRIKQVQSGAVCVCVCACV